MKEVLEAQGERYVVFERSDSGTETVLGSFETAGEAFTLVDERKQLKLKRNHRVTCRPAADASALPLIPHSFLSPKDLN